MMDLSNYRILVVEDSQDFLENVLGWLDEFGVIRDKIICAENGREALTRLKEEEDAGRKVNLVISDLRMPELSGMGLLKEMKKMPRWKETPFIMLTSGVAKDQREIYQVEFEKAGGDEIVLKSDIHKLRDAIEKVLTAKKGGG
jgi:CheY-like chemotaxis protein